METFIGSVCAPENATFKAEYHVLQCTTAGPYNTVPSNLLDVGSVCGFGADLVGVHTFNFAARFRVAACSTTLGQGLEKINAVHGHNCTPIFAVSPNLEKEFLVSLAHSRADAFDVICRLDRNDTLDELPQTKKHKVAIGPLLDKLHNFDFAGPLSSRASTVLGPVSRCRVVDILPRMKLVSRASRIGSLLGFFRVLCHGLCIAQRDLTLKNMIAHAVLDAQMNLTLSLTHCNECTQLFNIFVSFWRHAAILPQKSFIARLDHSLLPTPTHVRQLVLLDTCLQSRTKTSACQSSEPDIHIFPKFVPQHVKEAMITVDGQLVQMRVLALLMVELLLDGESFHDLSVEEYLSCLVPSSPPRLISLSLVPKHNPDNTAEMTVMIEALSFVCPQGPETRDEQSCFYYDSKHVAGVCLGTIQARTHVQLALACQQSMIRVQHRLRLTMQQVHGHGGNLGNECANHAAALGL